MEREKRALSFLFARAKSLSRSFRACFFLTMFVSVFQFFFCFFFFSKRREREREREKEERERKWTKRILIMRYSVLNYSLQSARAIASFFVLLLFSTRAPRVVYIFNPTLRACFWLSAFDPRGASSTRWRRTRCRRSCSARTRRSGRRR